MKKSGARTLILNALLEGKRLTAYDANCIGHTTAGARRIRQIREHYPVVKEQVAGEQYCEYYLDREWLAEYREQHKKPFRKRMEEFFGGLLDGGMFEGARV